MKSNKIQMPIHKKFKTFSKIKKRITRKKYRQFDIQRATKILDILPQFIKFYNKLSKSDIIAIKYYKGPGSYFQSQLLSGYDSKKKSNKLYFPIGFNSSTLVFGGVFTTVFFASSLNTIVLFANFLISLLKRLIIIGFTYNVYTL